MKPQRPLEKLAFANTSQFAIEFAAEGAEFFVEELNDVKMIRRDPGVGTTLPAEESKRKGHGRSPLRNTGSDC